MSDVHHPENDDHACGHHHATPAEPAPADAIVSLRGLKVRAGRRILIENINLDLAPREIVTIVGPNGSGKTTLVRALLGLIEPDEGKIHRKPGLRVGYVPQRFDLNRALPMTVRRFLSLGGTDRTAEISKVLAEAGAAHVEGQQMTSLSGGELQRVALARALLGKPDLLVLDEPVQGVDYAGEAELYMLITKLRDSRDMSVLMVSHDLHVVMASSDRVICLNRHICCSGVPETVAQHPEYARLFGKETGRAFALYHHHHDHRHDLTGELTDASGPAPEDPS